MTFDWGTLALQLINLLILLWLLQRFLYRPVLDLLGRRQAAIAKQLADAAADRREAAAARAALAAQQQALVQQRMDSLAALQTELDQLRSERLQAQDAQLAQRQEQARLALQQERRDAEIQLRRCAAELAGQFAQRVLQRLPHEALLMAYVDELASEITALPPPAVAGVCVVTAQPLSESASGMIIERLAPRLSGQPQWTFEVDPQLLGGLELHLDDTVIAHTLAQDLARLQAAVIEDDSAH